jgi:hypothetical protein
VVKKSIQKDSRNVVSNLLRIFFKNVLEVGYYDSQIEAVIGKFQLATSKTGFIEWLNAFNINFKNYIRFNEIKKIFAHPHSSAMQLILRILLRQYLNGYAICHCLTSRRIEKVAIKMHLEGLLGIQNDFFFSKN